MMIGVDHSYTERTEYKFCMIDGSIYLDGMFVMERESRRHKFRVDNKKSYSRIHSRDYGIKEEPEVPIEVSAEAVRLFRNQIKFKTWESRYK